MSNDESKGGHSGGGDLSMKDVAFTLKAMQQQFETFEREMMNMRGVLEEVRQSQQIGGTPNRRRGARKQTPVDAYIRGDVGKEEDSAYSMRDMPRREERLGSNINSIKMNIQSFKGRNDVETYLEWDRKVERIFERINGKTVTLASLSPKEVYQDQLKLMKPSNGGSGSEEKKIKGKEAKREKKQSSRPMVSDCTSEENKERCVGEKKSERESENKSEIKQSFFAKERDPKSAYIGRKSLIAIQFRESFLVMTDHDQNLPSIFVSLFQEFDEKERQQIEQNNRMHAQKATREWKQVIFEPDDWVWVHIRKERFPRKRKSELDPGGDGPFQVQEQIGDTAYKIDLPDSRTNLFEEGGIDASTGKDDASKGAGLKLPMGPITRSRAKKFKTTFQSFMDQFLRERLGGLAFDINGGPNVKIKEEDQPINLIQNVWAGIEVI